MKQYLDQKDEKWHVTFSIDIPRVLIKNKLNYRLHSIILKNGEVIRDPSISSSKYIFPIPPSFMGRKVFFFSYFNPKEIEEVDQFRFGLCDERVRWHDNTIISIKNEMPILADESEACAIESLSTEEQEPSPVDDIQPIEEVLLKTKIDTINYIDSDNVIELVSKIEPIAEEPLLISKLEISTEAPKKVFAKKAGRKKR